MEITVELPNDLTQREDPARAALEALAIAGYRGGKLSHYQASRILGLTRFEFDGFLKQRNILDHAYSEEDLQEDLESISKFEEKRKAEGSSPR
ncbi:MAG: UPF0175 family protein [Candidatus Acidiferrales bacterium]